RRGPRRDRPRGAGRAPGRRLARARRRQRGRARPALAPAARRGGDPRHARQDGPGGGRRRGAAPLRDRERRGGAVRGQGLRPPERAGAEGDGAARPGAVQPGAGGRLRADAGGRGGRRTRPARLIASAMATALAMPKLGMTMREGRVVAWATPGGGSVRRTAETPVTPAARALARRLGVEPARVPGTGPGGRVTREDVEAWAERRRALVPVAEGVALEVPTEGAGDPVVLLPGFGTDVSMFARQIPVLAERWHVLGVNTRGEGL